MTERGRQICPPLAGLSVDQVRAMAQLRQTEHELNLAFERVGRLMEQILELEARKRELVEVLTQ